MKEKIIHSQKPILSPRPDCNWADTMVLNPAIFPDPDSDDLLMLFRATGPYDHKRMPDATLPPFPIFLGFAVSHDNGETWDADFSRPCLAPALEYEADKIRIKDIHGREVVDYSNGCIEDPRVFVLEGKTYLTVACRLFPPGPYWDRDKTKYDHRQKNRPAWSQAEDNPLGKVATTNLTVTVLFEIYVDKLKKQDYEHAFGYVCNLTDGAVDDNRDVFFFPERMMIDGKKQYVLLQRPKQPHIFNPALTAKTPSIVISCAEKIEDFSIGNRRDQLLDSGFFPWASNRIGGSYPPIRLSEKEWLLPVHGKAEKIGYTQSFYILEERDNDLPTITHRCPERLMYAEKDWEMPDLFPDYCVFATAGIVKNDELIISYGAADQYCGIARAPFSELVDFVRSFDAEGNKIR